MYVLESIILYAQGFWKVKTLQFIPH